MNARQFIQIIYLSILKKLNLYHNNYIAYCVNKIMTTEARNQLPKLSAQANINKIQEPVKTASSKHLSPFTWSNIKLPILQQLKAKIVPNQQPFVEKVKININEHTQLKKIPEKSAKPKQLKNKIITGTIQQANQTVHHHQRFAVSLQQKLKGVQEKRKTRNLSHFETKLKTIDSDNNKTQFYFHNKNPNNDRQSKGKPEFRYRNPNSSSNNNHAFSQLKLESDKDQRYQTEKKQVKAKYIFEKPIVQKRDDLKNYRSLNLSPTQEKSPNKAISTVNQNITLGKAIGNFRKLKAVVDTADPHSYLKQKMASINRKNNPIQNYTFIGNPPKYIYDGLIKSGWFHLIQKSKYISPHMIWSSDDTFANYQNLQKNQIYNHVEGLHQLTIKGQFHKNSNTVNDCYPSSFIIGQGKQTQAFIRAYELRILKAYLRKIATAFRKKFAKEASNKEDAILQKSAQEDQTQRQLNHQKIPEMNIGYLLPRIMPTQCQQNLSIISLCIYFQKYCSSIKSASQYFKKMTNFIPIKVDSLSQNVFNMLIRKVTNQSTDPLNFLIYQQQSIIERNLEIMVMNYDRVLQLYDQEYSAQQQQNLWLVKPIGGSKGKGITFFNQRHYKEAIQLINQRSPKLKKAGTSPSAQSVKAFSINQNYSNKIIQKYVENPYLIEAPKQRLTKLIKRAVTKRRVKQNKTIKIEQEQPKKQENVKQNMQTNQINNQSSQKVVQLKQENVKQRQQVQKNPESQSPQFQKKPEVQIPQPLYQQYDSVQEILVVDQQAQDRRPWKQFYDRKFDFRQWVLVFCQDGQLKIFRFSDAYLRFCSQKYCVDKLDLNIHLTNYSHNKGQNQQKLTGILSQFLKQMPQPQSAFYTQLDSMIINSIIGLQQFSYGNPLSNSQKNCFQLLGYDVLLDKKGKLWLLEINVNPGCDSSRNQYLQKMANKMVQGMIEIVAQGKKKKENIDLHQKDRSIQIQNNKANINQNQNITKNKGSKQTAEESIKWVQIYSSKDFTSTTNSQSSSPKKKKYAIDENISVMRMIEKKTEACRRFDQISQQILTKVCFKLLKKHGVQQQGNSLLDQQSHQQQQDIEAIDGLDNKQPIIVRNSMQNLQEQSKSNSQKSKGKKSKARKNNQQNPGCCGQ